MANPAPAIDSYYRHATLRIRLILLRGVARAWRDHRASGTFILAFSRQKGLPGCDPAVPGGQAAAVADLAARLHREDALVGLDIAGFPERPFPPRAFANGIMIGATSSPLRVKARSYWKVARCC